MKTSNSENNAIFALGEFLDNVTSRLEALESHCGISSTSSTNAVAMNSVSSVHALQKTPSSRHISGSASETPGLKEFDKYLNTTIYKCADSCDDLHMGGIGKLFVSIFEGMRYVIVLAGRAKQPNDVAEIVSHLQVMTDPIGEIRKIRLEREFDNHQKALMEMLTCVFWINCRAPAQLPAPFVKECLGSSEFWSNRIRKEYKGKNDNKSKLHITFCDNLKASILGLVEFITGHHRTGLTFNPKGISLAEAAIRMTDNPLQDAAIEANRKKDQQANKKNQNLGTTVQGANMASLVTELTGRRSGDGSSAATGLRKVSKEQQTWRKEFKGGDNKVQVPVTGTSLAQIGQKTQKKKKLGLPVLEYQERGNKWVIENFDKEEGQKRSTSGVLEVEVIEPKQQVYVYNCEDITIKILGSKLKSCIIDKCKKVNVIFPTIISGCEIVNSNKIAIQSDGVCPVFTIDKTVGVSVYLSKESAAVSSFTTSMSSEMNVSVPEDDDYKEIPIPEQFVHTIADSSLRSEVSELYR